MDLRDSHFIPRSFYALVRTPEYEPVRFSKEAMYPTSKQTKDYVFCGDCEQLLNHDGENCVRPLLPMLGGPFPLRDLLMKQAPIYQDADKALYATATNPEIDAPKLMHFAVGIFYKAAVHSWRGEPVMELAPDGIEALRLYLLGKADLPKTMTLCVTVDSLPIVWQTINEPYRAENLQGFERYVFYVPGVLFQLLIGDGVQKTMAANCINANPLRPVLVEDVSKPMRNTMREMLTNARRTKKLEETQDEINKRSLSVRLGD
jgi:hypothetical protein